MRPLVVLAIVLLVLFLVGQVRVGGRVEYCAEGLFAWLRLGPWRLKVYPTTGEKKKKPPEKGKKEKKKQGELQTAAQRAGGALEYAQALLPIALEGAEHCYSRLQVDKLRLELTAGSSDPADTAMLYGRANAALGALWEPMVRVLHVKDGSARVKLDFEARSMTLYGEASLSLKVGQVLWLALYYGGRALMAFLAVRKKQKQTTRKAV